MWHKPWREKINTRNKQTFWEDHWHFKPHREQRFHEIYVLAKEYRNMPVTFQSKSYKLLSGKQVPKLQRVFRKQQMGAADVLSPLRVGPHMPGPTRPLGDDRAVLLPPICFSQARKTPQREGMLSPYCPPDKCSTVPNKKERGDHLGILPEDNKEV